MLCCAVQAPEHQQLSKNGMVLDDAKKLAEVKIENEDMLAVVFAQEGEHLGGASLSVRLVHLYIHAWHRKAYLGSEASIACGHKLF